MSTAPYRARIVGTKHMAAAGHYLAAQAALQVLEAGGNAIDAGVAGGITLGIVQSEYVGFGGVAPIMIYLAERDEVVSISGLGTWPALTDVSVFNEQYGGRFPQGLLRCIVPAAHDSWITALERYGTMSYGDCAAAALRFARDGFVMPKLMADIIADYEDDYRKWPVNAAIYLPNGKVPKEGDLFVQADLANTIAYIIDEEKAALARGGSREAGLKAARDAFYKGDIARAIDKQNRENGGWMRYDDLANFHVEVEKPLAVNFGGADIFTCGPWCQGPVLGQAMAMLDGIDLKGLGHNSAAYIHRLVETLKLAYGDRHALYGDPNFVDVPLQTLLSSDYSQQRRGLIDPDKAHPGMPDPGLPTNWGRQPKELPDTEKDPGQLDTSFICAVDRYGNAFAATPSDGSTGAPMAPGLGFVASARGVQSFTEPDAPAVAGPGRRPRLTPAPGFARRKGEWIMPFGSPGNDVQPQAMLQVFLNIHVFGMTPMEAIEAPRFATFSYPRSSSPHPFDPGLLKLEKRIPAETVETLRAMGHDARDWPEWDFAAGAVCTIIRKEGSGTMEGASDPRRPSAVAGW